MGEKITSEDLVLIKEAAKEGADAQLEPILKKFDEQVQKWTEEQASLKNEAGESIDLKAMELRVADIESQKQEFLDLKSKVEAGTFGVIGEVETKSFGEQITEHKGFSKDGIEIDDISFSDFLQKDITSVSDCGFPLGVQSQPDSIRPLMTPKLGLVDCITFGRTTATSHKNTYETGFAPLCADIVIEGSTADSIILEPVPGVAGFIIGHEIKISGEDTVVVAIDPVTNTLTLNPPLSAPPTVTETTVKNCTTEVFPKVIAKYSGATPEKMLKPKSDISFGESVDVAIKIARWICVSDEAFKSLPRLQQYINMRLRHFMRLTLEWHLAYGAGGTDQLTGLFNVEGRQEINWSDGDPGDNKLDAIKNACTRLEVSGFDGPIKIVINPYDLDELLKMKDTQGRYLGNGPHDDCEDARLWCKQVVTSSCVKRGQVAVVNMDMAFAFFECVGPNSDTGIRTSNEDRDNFIRNARTVLTEMSIIQECPYPEAVAILTFDTCPPEAVKPEMAAAEEEAKVEAKTTKSAKSAS